jgi:glucose-6-phosphate-specific signal transduction histidine kinase
MDITPIRQARQRAHELLLENRRLTRRLFDVQEKERRHLARELHDELGQWLTAIQAEAQAMYTMNCLKEHPACRESSQAIVDSTGQLHQVVRRILRRLRPTLLEQLGLADSLRELISQWQGSHPDIDCDLILDGALDDLDKRLEITLYRVVQGGLTNISTHSGASRISLAVRRAPGAIMLSLQDNGMGMSDMPLSRQGMGLLGMRERVIAADGEFTMRSTPGQGLRIDVTLPLNLSEDHNENFGLEDH